MQDMIKIYVTVDERGFLKGELQSKGVQDMITIYNCRSEDFLKGNSSKIQV